jgi:glycerol-3-phosphate O-acyltransferase
MHLKINDNTSLREIEETFSNYYPYLKLEFFHKSHKKYEASLATDRVNPYTKVGDLNLKHMSGALEIRPLYRIADVEKEFRERFGLSIQILCKEKDHWEQTAGMDDFTFKDLNQFGRSSSDELVVSEFDEEFKEVDEKPEKLL